MSKARDIADLNATSLADLSDNSISGEFQVGSLNVGGTTVIDDSRNLSNVGGLKTVGGTNILGSGDISVGGSTTYGAVGTYTIAHVKNTVSNKVSSGETRSGSSLYQIEYLYGRPLLEAGGSTTATASGLSGTWRNMAGEVYETDNARYGGSLWVRIS